MAMSRRALGILIPPLIAGLWGAALGFGHLRGDMWFLDRVEATMSDVRTLLRGQRPPPDRVTIVAIDDAFAQSEGGYPLSRATLARLVDTISGHAPEVIAVDVLLVDPGPEDGDRALTSALAKSPAVLAAAAVFANSTQRLEAGGGILSEIPKADRFVLPLQRFADVAAVGVVNVATDRSGTPRFVPMVFTDGSRLEPSFPLRVAARATGHEPSIGVDGLTLGGRFIATDLGHALPLAFYGPRGSIHTLSAAAVLDGEMPRDSLRGQVVVIGATVTGGGDLFPSPFDPVLPGVEVMASAIAQLMDGGGMVRDHRVRLADAGFATVLPMLVVGLLAWRRSLAALAAITVVVLAWGAINVIAFAEGIWLSAALPITAAGPPAILFGAIQIWLHRRRAHYFARQSILLQHVQAPGLGAFLARNPDFLSEPVRQDAAILFIDISGFTGLSETLGPNAVRELLDGFYRLVDEEATASGGAITSFLGDGAMVLFGLPHSAADDAFNAASCAVGLSRRTRDWLAALPGTIASRIGFKIGAHFGTIVASRLGGINQQITATGDTVNVASRLMEVAADHGAELAVSDEMLEAAGRDSALYKGGVLTGPIETQIRGRTGSLPVWLWREDAVGVARAEV
jgi:adenylate cyclase